MEEVRCVVPEELEESATILLRKEEAAALCGCSERTWHEWDLLGLVPRPVKMRRTKYWVRDELIAWVQAKCPKRDVWRYRAK